MKFKFFLHALIAVFVWGSAFATSENNADVVAKTLAPSGELIVGVYLGSPTSMVLDPKNGSPHGVAVELGERLANAIHRPIRIVKFDRVAQVIDALKKEQVDITFTNATSARAKDVNFTAPVIRLELGVLVPTTSPIRQFMDINDKAFRLGVTKGSSSQNVLGTVLNLTTIIPIESLDQAQKMLTSKELDGFATNKGILFELNEHISGFKVLDDHWGLENLALAIPKGREEAIPFLNSFAKQQLTTGEIDAIAQRAGLRGIAKD